MAENSTEGAPNRAQTAHNERDRLSAHRGRKKLPDAHKAPPRASSGRTKSLPSSNVGGELAVLDDEALAIQIVQPERGIGSRMPADVYHRICLLLREGVPPTTLSDRFGYSRTTIATIKTRHADIIPSHREQMTGKAENLRELLSDKMVEAVKNGRMSPNQYAFTYGVVTDKYLTESGQNGQKHEHIHVNVTKNELSDLLSGANRRESDSKSGEGGQEVVDVQ